MKNLKLVKYLILLGFVRRGFGLNKFKLTIGLILFVNLVYSQNSDFLKNYYPISLKFGLSQFTGVENSHYRKDLYYNFNNFISPVVGLEYDFLKFNNFNFKTGLSATLIKENQKLLFSQKETGFGYDLDERIKVTTNGMWRLSVPLTTEYLIDTKIGILSLNASFIVGYHNEFGEGFIEYDNATIEGEQRLNYKNVYSRYSAPWYFNGQIGVGMYFPFDGWMLRTNIFYNQAFQKLYEGDYQFTHLQQSTDFGGTFGFKGNSYGIEFSIYLAKKKKGKS